MNVYILIMYTNIEYIINKYYIINRITCAKNVKYNYIGYNTYIYIYIYIYIYVN